MEAEVAYASVLTDPALTIGADLPEKVADAARIIAPVWPLKSFIACNPLQGLEDLPFDEAVSRGARLFQIADTSPELENVNCQVIKWCLAFLDEGQATLMMPNREQGFYAAWRALAPFDAQLHHQQTTRKNWLAGLPEKPENALAFCLLKLGIPADDQLLFLTRTLTYLPGWAGYIKWRENWQSASPANPNPVTLLEFLAVRLAITCLLWPQAGQRPLSSDTNDERIAGKLAKLNEDEARYQQKLMGMVLSRLRKPGPLHQRPDAQLVFCIDVRSEPFRRQLEAQGHYETLGFAGFFGLPVRVHECAGDEAYDSCPVLLKPAHSVYQQPTAGQQHKLGRFHRGKRAIKMVRAFYQRLKYNFATPFALVETLGAGCGLLMLERTLIPTQGAKFHRVLTETIRPRLALEPVFAETAGIPRDQQAVYAESALRLMGLTDNFGKLVVFCGHGSTVRNNPYSSALDCGACGGNHGGANAQVLAAILNTPLVRLMLARKGIHIPMETIFLAAEHDTTTDDLTIYENSQVASQPFVFQKLQQALVRAKFANASWRCGTFGEAGGGRNPIDLTLRRSSDWAEVRPEWGLARNAAFIIGPRWLTQALDLEGRCFLHSYEWEQDEAHTSLETILTAPMVVAQWINTQYLFSTLDNVAYGSGSKVTHNVAGKLGIMQGNASDLMHGLPLQSVNATDNELYHDPQRLLTVVFAPRASIDLIIGRQAILQKLFFNGWVKLIAIDPEDNKAYRLDSRGHWCPLPD
ncbi:DUF2309 domain-containing protein [Spirosoma rigui]|uniref:DUF2309 domain-containing protein n=1 Tax=Spirosoma rigui TaxID=564064 RepID=UPI0009B008B9|nr:DUF2309 domain-containing protein [Spirosoma rigui]